jgi:hypothetical protein
MLVAVRLDGEGIGESAGGVLAWRGHPA